MCAALWLLLLLIDRAQSYSLSLSLSGIVSIRSSFSSRCCCSRLAICCAFITTHAVSAGRWFCHWLHSSLLWLRQLTWRWCHLHHFLHTCFCKVLLDDIALVSRERHLDPDLGRLAANSAMARGVNHVSGIQCFRTGCWVFNVWATESPGEVHDVQVIGGQRSGHPITRRRG